MTPTLADAPPTPGPRIRPVVFDLYRDIHKGIRAELFAVTLAAGRIDPADDVDVSALATKVADVVQLLVEHAAHEDGHIELDMLLPELAEQIATEHHALETRMAWLIGLADEAAAADAGHRRAALHEVYLELAAFTGAYLLHQDVEERRIMPALSDAIGVDEVIRIHEQIVGSMAPDQLARGLVAILPAGNVDDRSELLGGIRAGTPPEAFTGVWNLATSVLAPTDATDVARRLGI